MIRNLDDNSADPEIVYVDDFLGQSCLEIASSSISSVKLLLSYIERHTNKYLIINSRIQVLNEAENDNNEVCERLKNAGFIDLGSKELSFLEKASILYSHIVSSKIGIKRISMLVKDGYYLSIIKHKNYLPRIIQYLFNENQYPKSEDQYIAYVEDTLNHPEKVWENEYNKRIFPEDRMLLETIYSVSDYRVEQDALRKAFNKQKGGANYTQVDSSKAFLFENSVKRLNGGFIFLSTNGNRTTIQVSNPSINDFLKTVFQNKSPELIEDMADRCVSFEQLYRLGGESYFEDRALEKRHKKGFTYSAVVFNQYFYYETILNIASLRIDNSERFFGLIVDAINYFTKSTYDSFDYAVSRPLDRILVRFVNDNTFDYYPNLLRSPLFDLIIGLVRYKCSYDVALEIYKNCPNLDEEKASDIFDIILDGAIMDAYDSIDTSSFIKDIPVSEYCDYEESDGHPIVDYSRMAEKLKEELVDYIYLNSYGFEGLREVEDISPISSIDIENVLNCYCDFEDLVKDYFNEDDYDSDDFADSGSQNGGDERITVMFESLLS